MCGLERESGPLACGIPTLPRGRVSRARGAGRGGRTRRQEPLTERELEEERQRMKRESEGKRGEQPGNL